MSASGRSPAFSRIGGAVLHYRDLGRRDAMTVMTVNSLGTDMRIWDGVADALAGSFRVVSYDKRGHGLSDAPEGACSIDGHLADLIGLADHLDVAAFAVLGVSIGGMVGLAAAARHPARVKAAVLCDTAVRIGTRESWNDRIDAVSSRGLGEIANAVMERWFSCSFRTTRREELAGYRNMLVRTDPAGYVASCAAVRDADLTADAAAVGCPVLVLCGGEDGSTPPALVEATARMIPGSAFRLIEGTGHIPSVERPETVAELTREFLERAWHG